MGSAAFAAAIAGALRRDFPVGGVKTVAGLTLANERAVKNWFDGRNAPSGEFLVMLCRHSDQVLETFLTLSGRPGLVSAKKLVDARLKLREMLAILDEMESR